MPSSDPAQLATDVARSQVVAGMPLTVVLDAVAHAGNQLTVNSRSHADQRVAADWMQRFKDQLIAVIGIVQVQLS